MRDSEDSTNHELVRDLRSLQRSSWQSGERVVVELFVDRHPALAVDLESTLELVYNEILVRNDAGETANLADYQKRFPSLADRLEVLFEVHAALDEGGSPTLSKLSVERQIGTAESVVSIQPVIPGLEILGEIGRGGMSVVYEARQTALNRRVGLKMLLAGGSGSQEQRSRFRTEAEALARLHHPNIVPIHEVGEAGGRPFLIMEYVGGGTLERRLGGQPAPRRCCRETPGDSGSSRATCP